MTVMWDSDRLTILVGLLDFFSDRATAHASFVVATIFGIYTILFAKINGVLLQEVFVLAYLALAVIDIYSFLNFGYYASVASEIRYQLMGYYSDDIERTIQNNLRRHRLYYSFRWFRSGINYKSLKFLLILVLWLSAVVLPFVAVLNLLPPEVWYVICYFIIPIIVGIIMVFGFVRGYVLAKRHKQSERT